MLLAIVGTVNDLEAFATSAMEQGAAVAEHRIPNALHPQAAQVTVRGANGAQAWRKRRMNIWAMLIFATY